MTHTKLAKPLFPEFDLKPALTYVKVKVKGQGHRLGVKLICNIQPAEG
jgi:hypothetical protein